MDGRRRWSRYGLAFGAAVAVLLVAALLGERHLQRPLLRMFERHLHHPLRLGGRFEAHLLSPHPRLDATDLEIGNPPWSAPGSLGHIARVDIRLAWRFGWWPLEIERVELGGAEWHLRRDAEGRANWTARAEGAGAGPPLIRSLVMPEARVDVQDERRHLTFTGQVSAGDAGAGPAPVLTVEATGTLNGRPATLHIEGEPLATARRERPYHFTLLERSAPSQLSAQGYFLHPFDFREIEGLFQAKGPTLRDAYYLVGLKLPQTVPFSASGRMSRRNLHFSYADLRVTAGDSDLDGSLEVDSAGGQPHTTGELRSQQLRLVDLGGHHGEAQSLVPDTPLPLRGLRRSELRIRYRAQHVDLGKERLSELSLLVDAHAAALRIEQAHAQLAGGELSGEAQLDAHSAVPAARLELRLQKLQLEQLQPPGRAPFATGTLDGRLQLAGAGPTWRALAEGAHGEATLVIPEGTMRRALAELASAELAGALGVLRHNTQETPIRCAVATLSAQDGVVRTGTLLLDTDATLLSGAGELHLADQTVQLRIRGRPKHPTLALRSEVTVTGPLKHPHFGIEKRAALLQGGAAVALGALLTPLAAGLAFVDPGLTHGADCGALLAEARSEAHDSAAGPVTH